MSSYDNIAGLYDVFWADWYLPAAMPALEKLFFSKVPAGARVLDLCCGSGHVTKELVARGYSVTGVDFSEELVLRAQEKLPQAEFRVQDVRALSLGRRYDAVLSTFDSLNHVLEMEDLRKVFAGVRRHLEEGAPFVFDMNDEQAYFLDLRQWVAHVDSANVGLIRGTYDAEVKLARTELLWFKQRNVDKLWEQNRSIVDQRCYAKEEIIRALADSRFRHIEAIWAAEAGVTADLGFGRIFYATCA